MTNDRLSAKGVYGQSEATVRFEWGPTGAATVSSPHGATVVIDVFSFTTSVSIAVDRGAAVIPYNWDDAGVDDYAQKLGAEVAVGRGEEDDSHPWSLSPSSLLTSPLPKRLVLPSPNGSTIAAAARGEVITCSFRNYPAVAAWLRDRQFGSLQRPIAIIAAGERWPGDGGLRPALEDLLCAALLSDSLTVGDAGAFSPEAAATRALGRSMSAEQFFRTVRDCSSARELQADGFGRDVELALEVGVGKSVPVIRDGCFCSE